MNKGHNRSSLNECGNKQAITFTFVFPQQASQPKKLFKPGQTVSAKVVGVSFNRTQLRLSLSLTGNTCSFIWSHNYTLSEEIS